MARFLSESPHTKEECLQALDGLVEQGPGVLEQYQFGCMAGDHTGWATVEANSEAEAREKVPAVVRGKARVVPVSKITAEQVRSFHEM